MTTVASTEAAKDATRNSTLTAKAVSGGTPPTNRPAMNRGTTPATVGDAGDDPRKSVTTAARKALR